MPISRKRKKKKKHAHTKRHQYNANGVSRDVDKKMRENLAKKGLNYTSSRMHPHRVSELVLELLESKRHLCETSEDEEHLVNLGIVCWNLSVIDNEELREKKLNDFLNRFGKEYEEIMRDLIDAKLKYHDEYKYFIANYDISYLPDGTLYLSVASAKLD